MPKKSYFAILGVSSKASHAEVKSAFRRLAKEFHPDRFEGGSEPFRQIQEAYDVLGDTCRRKAYEESLFKTRATRIVGRGGHRAPEPLIPKQRPADIGDIPPSGFFESLAPSFGPIFEGLGRHSSGGERSPAGKIQHLTLEVRLTRDQALRGGTARVMVPAQAPCPACRGYGAVGPFDCPRCAGEGFITGEVPVAIEFPAGLARDQAVKIPLDRFGIRNRILTVRFRSPDENDL